MFLFIFPLEQREIKYKEIFIFVCNYIKRDMSEIVEYNCPLCGEEIIGYEYDPNLQHARECKKLEENGGTMTPKEMAEYLEMNWKKAKQKQNKNKKN